MRFASRTALVLGLLAPAATPQTCVQPFSGLRVWWDADDVKWEPGHNRFPYATDSTDRIAGPPLTLADITQTPDPSLWLPQFGPGQVGQAFSFDPSHPQFVNLGMSTAFANAGSELELTAAMSIELWMKWNPAVSYSSPYFGLIDTCTDGYYFSNLGFLLYGNGNQSSSPVFFRLGSGSQASEVSGTSNVKDGAWHHIVATHDASLANANQKIYVDGVLQASADWNQLIAYDGRNCALARGPVYGGFRGLIDEVMLYDRALTVEEVDAAYHSPGRCRPDFPARPNPSAAIGPFSNTPYPYNNRVGEDLDLDGDVLAVAEPANGEYHLTGAHVFRRIGGSWIHEQMVVPSTPPEFANGHGFSVAVSGNVLVQGIWRGFAVHRFDGASWNQEFHYQNWPNPPFELGADVDVSGDTLVVGAPGGEACAVEVYRHLAGQWQREAVISGPNWSKFGQAVALEGDLLVVGAWNASLVGSGGGGLFVYRRTGSTWNQIDVVTPDEVAPGRSNYDHFRLGRDIDLEGERVLIGAQGSIVPRVGDFDPAWEGSGFVVDLSGGGTVVEGELRSALPTRSLAFGSGTLRLQGDLAVMGASYGGEFSAYSANSTGSVCVFARQGGVWTEVGRCRASSGDIGLGRSVALDGARVLAAAPGHQRIWSFDGFEAVLNSRPIANAGVDQIVDEGTLVTLDGSASSDGNGDVLDYSWTQVAGPEVTLSGAGTVAPSFLSPNVGAGGTTLTFVLVVDDGELASDGDHVDVTVTNQNQLPVAEAGADQVVAESSSVALNGADSYDVDGEDLSYSWSQVGGPSVVLSSADEATATFKAPAVGPAGTLLTFELIVGDGLATSAPDTIDVSVTNVNNAPVASAGAPTTVDEGTHAFLDGSGSSDPDGDVLGYSWTQVGGPAVSLSNPLSQTPSFIAPDVFGVVELDFELVVSDGLVVSDPSLTTVTVRDTNAPPTCTQAAADKPMLWPPNHKMVAVRVVGVSDPDDESITITILGVHQDEPTNGLGDGDTGPADAVIQGDTVLLRAERSGLGNGRVYHIQFRAEDATGAMCTGTVQVVVPHDKKKPVIDGGPLYDSTGGA